MSHKLVRILLVAPLALGCADAIMIPTVSAEFFIVDDGTRSFRAVASNEPARFSVWNSMAQSFTAVDRRIAFGFRLKDADRTLPNAGATIVYNLYAGENSYGALLASRAVTLPSTLAGDRGNPPVVGDVGFVDADFAAVVLIPGLPYTMEVTVPPTDLPSVGTSTGFGVITSLANPYGGGRFYFPIGYDNTFFTEQDMIFRAEPASLASLISALVAGVSGVGPGASLASMVANIQALWNAGSTRAACQAIAAFEAHVKAQAGKSISQTAAVVFLDDAASIRYRMGC